MLGARFTGRNRHPAIGDWETTSTIVACEPERVFEWAVSDPDNPSSSWRFELEPSGDGTRLKQWMRMGPGWSGLNVAIDARPDKEERIIERRLEEHRANMTAQPRWHQGARRKSGWLRNSGSRSPLLRTARTASAFVQEAERLGVHSVWSAEAWGFDALTPLAYLAAKTSTIKLGTGIAQVGCANSGESGDGRDVDAGACRADGSSSASERPDPR